MIFSVLVTGLFGAGEAIAQTGKVSGTVTDAESGEPLPGVNVVIVGEQIGATTDQDGRFVILNVPPGTYDVRASFVGYATQTIQGIEVNIDLTTEVSFELQEETAELEEVTVQATERVVKPDVSSSRIDLNSEDMSSLPVADVSEVIGLQAGIQNGLQVRGSGMDELDFRVDGASMVSGREGTPYTNVSFTAVQEVQVQTGGFNAEYGNVRSGVVNVVTREGPRDRYTADVLARMRPPSKKHFGPPVDSPESYWVHPYLDEDSKWVGTEQGWDNYKQRQYPEFGGYEEIARSSLQDDDPSNNLTPKAAEQLFRWRHRRDLGIREPDYEIDASIGGPVPVVSEFLGDLRFFASFRREQDQYIIPLSRRGYDAHHGRIKLTANVTPSMKLNLTGMLGEESGTRVGAQGGNTAIRKDDRERKITNYRPFGFVRGIDDVSFVQDGLSIVDIGRKMVSGDFTHTLSPSTFYRIQAKWFQTDWLAGPVRPRDTETILRKFAGFAADEAPYGFEFGTRNSIVSGLFLAGHNSLLRDTTTYNQYDLQFDLTSQVHRFHQAKVGVRFNQTYQDEKVILLDALPDPSDTRHEWEEQPIYGAAYAQDKIEFEGMIANLGVRLDYFDANTQWFAYDNAFNDAFMGKNADRFEDMLDRKPVDPHVNISPRVGISFPVTTTSKLFFNYGHFVQNHDPEDLYMVQRSRLGNQVWRMANPSAPPPKTISYELGYEQSLFEQYLIRVSGYYKDLRNQPRSVQYNGRQGLVSYSMNMASNYEDIRGFEASLYKNAGRWFRGFINYTFQVTKAGNFGLGQFFENPIEQRRFERQTTENQQFKPRAQPFGRISLDFLTPPEFGPSFGRFNPLAQWRLNILGRWRTGNFFTWTGDRNIPGINNNFQWPDFRMVDVRFSKTLNLIPGGDAQFFADVNNVFNIKNFNQASFSSGSDFDSYMNTLHLPEEKTEDIPGWDGENGDDAPGDLDADYIDPPNLNSIRFLFPRSVNFGVRLSF